MQEFCVHKIVLGVGPRKCQYFSTLFATVADVVEKQESTSRIGLTGPDAKAFPIMLDYCYSLTNVDDLPQDDVITVVALRNLASYFDCAALTKKTNDLVRKSLSVATGLQYLVAAAEYQDARLEEAARKLCSEHLASLPKAHVLKLPVELFQSLMAAPSLKCDSKYLASIIVSFFQQHPDILSATLLSELTDERKMPQIDELDAPTFLDLIRRLNVTVMEEWNQLRSLCLRCSKALAKKKEWLSWDVEAEVRIMHCQPTTADESDKATSALVQPEAEILVSLLVASLMEARNDYHDETSRLKLQVESFTAKLADTTTMKDQLHDSHQRLTSTNRELQSQVSRLESNLRSASFDFSRLEAQAETFKSKLAEMTVLKDELHGSHEQQNATIQTLNSSNQKLCSKVLAQRKQVTSHQSS
jgi:hypothetical protein